MTEIFSGIFNEFLEIFICREGIDDFCKTFHGSILWSDFISKYRFGILNIKAKKVSSSFFSGFTVFMAKLSFEC